MFSFENIFGFSRKFVNNFLCMYFVKLHYHCLIENCNSFKMLEYSVSFEMPLLEDD